jgi:hypothetical protein
MQQAKKDWNISLEYVLPKQETSRFIPGGKKNKVYLLVKGLNSHAEELSLCRESFGF